MKWTDLGLKIRKSGKLLWAKRWALGMIKCGNFLTSWGTISFSRMSTLHEVMQLVNYNFLKNEKKYNLGKLRHRWEDNTKMDLKIN
jgi:hypothetical protein